MAYSDVTGFSRIELIDNFCGKINYSEINSPFLNRSFYLCITPVDSNNNFVDIESEVEGLIDGYYINLVDYFSNTGTGEIRSAFSFSYSMTRNNIVYIRFGYNQDINYYHNLAVKFLLKDEATTISTAHGSDSGFDSSIVINYTAPAGKDL